MEFPSMDPWRAPCPTEALPSSDPTAASTAAKPLPYAKVGTPRAGVHMSHTPHSTPGTTPAAGCPACASQCVCTAHPGPGPEDSAGCGVWGDGWDSTMCVCGGNDLVEAYEVQVWALEVNRGVNSTRRSRTCEQSVGGMVVTSSRRIRCPMCGAQGCIKVGCSRCGAAGAVWQVWCSRCGAAGVVWQVWCGRCGAAGVARQVHHCGQGGGGSPWEVQAAGASHTSDLPHLQPSAPAVSHTRGRPYPEPSTPGWRAPSCRRPHSAKPSPGAPLQAR
eukprot:364245-Chlamydomonas_euryale.AAC.6